MTNMIPALIAHMQASYFSTFETDDDVMESTSTHPCHRLSIPAARLFWCRHCMQIFEDPITRWRHSKTCLHSSSGKVRKDKDGSTMQVFLSANSSSDLRREQNRSRVINRNIGAGHSPSTDLRCFICKTTFASIEEMRVHVRTPCRKRPTLAAPKQKFSAMPAEIKTQIQIPDTASEIIYIKDGHQTVISLESPYTTEIIEPISQGQITAVETVAPVASKGEEVTKQPKNRNENKENNIRKRKRILPKEVDDWPNHKMSNSPKSDPQIVLSLPTKPDDAKDISDDFETPPIKISKMTNKESDDETGQAKVRTKPLQTKEEFSQLLTTERKENQFFLEGEHLLNGVVTEQVSDEAVLLTAPASPVEKIVTGAAAEAKLKDLFTTIEMQNKMKLSPSPKQAKSVNPPPESPCKTSNLTNIGNDTDECQNDDVEKDENQPGISHEKEIDNSGLLLYMPPINAGSVTLPDPLLDLQSGLPAEMLLDETTNTKPPIPTAPEAMNTFVSSDLVEETKLPSHIFDGDLLPSQIHSEVLFEEITDEKENSPLVDNRIDEELVLVESNLEEAVKIDSPVGINQAEEETEESATSGQVLTVEEAVTTELVTPVDSSHIFTSIEEIPLPVTVDHIEEITHTVEEIPISTTVDTKEITPVVEQITLVETVTSVQNTIFSETVPPVGEPTHLEPVTEDLETTSIKTLSSFKENIPVETLATVLKNINIENVPLVKEPTTIEPAARIEAPPSASGLAAVIEAVPSIPELATDIESPSSVPGSAAVLEDVPPVQEPAVVVESVPPVQEAAAVVESVPPVQEPLLVVESVPPVPEAAAVVESVPPVQEPLLVVESVPPVQEPLLVVESVPPVQEPLLVVESVPPVQEPLLVVESVPPVQEPLLVVESVPPVQEPLLVVESVPPVPEPSAVVESVPPVPEPSAVVESVPPVPEPSAVVESVPPVPEPSAVVESVPPVPEPSAVVESVPPVPEPSAVVESVPPVPEPSAVVELVPPVQEPVAVVEAVSPVLETAMVVEAAPLLQELDTIVQAAPSVPELSASIEATPLALELAMAVEASSSVPELEVTVNASPSVLGPATEANSSVVEPTIETVSSAPKPDVDIETVPSVAESVTRKTVLPVMKETLTETVPSLTYTDLIESNCVAEEIKFGKVTPSLKSEENPEIPVEELELEHVNKVESVLPLSESLEMSDQSKETNPEENTEVKIKVSADEEEETIDAEKSETETKHKLSKLFKCKACSNTFKTSQALQKHSRVPCKIKHTRSLSQKILRPKQPCLKIEKKPMKKKMVKPTRRPKLMIPIIPITRSELIRPAVPRRPKRFSRRKRKKTYFIDEQNRILPFVNVLMSELSDKDRFFYKLGMINQCHKIPSSSETTTSTAQNGEAPALETLGDSAEESLLKLQFTDIMTESTYPPEIAPLSLAEVVADEPQEISYTASPAVAGACVSDKENPSALAKGLCLSLPTLEKMDNNQFHDPNSISPSSVNPESHDTSSEMTGQSVQSPCWEAAPRLAQLPGVTQIVRVTSSADLSNETGMTKKPSPESDQCSVIANSKNLPFSNSSTLSKTQSKEISQEVVNDSSLNISGNLLLKCEEIEVLDLNEPHGNVFQNSASQPEIVSLSLQELSLKDQSCSSSKLKIQKTNKKKKSGSECKIQLKKSKIISPEYTNSSRSSISKNSIKSKLNHSLSAKYNVIKSINPTKNHNRIKDRNQKQTDSFTGANIAMRQKKHRSGDSSISNSQKGISSSVSQDVTCLSSKNVTSNRNSAEPVSSVKKMDLEFPLSKPCSVSLRKHVQPQYDTQRKNTLRAVKIKDVSNKSDLSSHQNKISSMLTVSTRSSPLRNEVLDFLHNQKGTDSLIQKKKKIPASQSQENRIGKPGNRSLKDKNVQPVSKSLQIAQRKSSHISNLSRRNFKKDVPSRESANRDCQTTPSKYSFTDTLSSLSEKMSTSSEKNPLEGEMKRRNKGQKQPAQPSEKTATSLSRVTRRTQKLNNSLTDFQDVQKTVASVPELGTRTLPARKCSDAYHKTNLKVSPGVSTQIKDCLDSGKRDALSEEKVTDQQEQLPICQTNSTTPTSETKLRKNKSITGKPTTRNQHASGSPSTDHSNTTPIPYLRTRSLSKSELGGVKNEFAPQSKNLISKSLTNDICFISSQTKSEICSELITKQSLLDENLSSPPEFHNTDSNFPTNNDSTCLSKSVSIEDNKINSNLARLAESPDTSILKNENLKDVIKPSPMPGECHPESSVTELVSGESSLNSGSRSPCKTEVTAVSAVTSTTVTTSVLSHSSNNGTMTNLDPVEHKTLSPNSETPCNLSTTTTSNPRVSIATQTDTSFLKEIKTGVNVPSDSCDNVEKNEPLPSSVSLNPDPPLPSSPPTNTNPSPTSVDVIPPPTVVSIEERSEEVVQEKSHLDANPLPLSPEIVINDNHLSTISPPAETTYEPVQEGEVVLQEKTDDSVLLQQSVPATNPPVAVETLEQQLVLDNTTDPNVLVQYLNSLDPSILPGEVTFVIIQGTPGEALHLTNDHNFIIEQTGDDSAGGSVIYTLQSPPSDIATEAEIVMTDSS